MTMRRDSLRIWVEV